MQEAVLDMGIWIVEGTDDLDESGVRHIILNGRTTMCEQFEDIDYARFPSNRGHVLLELG